MIIRKGVDIGEISEQFARIASLIKVDDQERIEKQKQMEMSPQKNEIVVDKNAINKSKKCNSSIHYKLF